QVSDLRDIRRLFTSQTRVRRPAFALSPSETGKSGHLHKIFCLCVNHSIRFIPAHASQPGFLPPPSVFSTVAFDCCQSRDPCPEYFPGTKSLRTRRTVLYPLQ